MISLDVATIDAALHALPSGDVKRNAITALFRLRAAAAEISFPCTESERIDQMVENTPHIVRSNN